MNLELTETLSWSQGRRLQRRTRGGDDVARYQKITADPSITLTLDPDVAADKSFQTVFYATEEHRRFDLQVGDGVTTTTGIRVQGSCVLDTPNLDMQLEEKSTRMTLTLRPVGMEWTQSLAVEDP